MIDGVGLDTVEPERIAKAVSRWGSRFLKRIFTDRELLDCRNKHDITGSFAARFAVKEAAMKALGTGRSEGIGWTDIEVVVGKGGRPYLVFHGTAQKRMRGRRAHASLTHDGRTAAAMVVIETGEE